MKTIAFGSRARAKRSAFTVAAAALLGVALAAGPAIGAGSAASAASSPSGSTLRIEAQTAFSTFNPFEAYFDGDLEVLNQIYPFITASNAQGTPVPYLGTKWSLSADKLTWTFTIRSGLKWSDGKPITAADAAWTLNLIMHNAAAGTANGSLVSSFKTVTAPNATTLVITTKQPEANVAYSLTIIPIVPEHIWSAEVPNLSNFKNQSMPVVGYGPWKLTGYATSQYATMTANSDFFMGAPKFHTLIVQYYSNQDAAVAALRSGQLDSIEYMLTATQYNSLKGQKNIAVYPQVSGTWTAIELNPGAQTRSGRHFGNGNPALTNVKVRQAIEMALNKNELVSKVMGHLAIPGQAYLPPTYPEFRWTPPASQQLNYDPAKANALLNSAGYKMGPNGVRISPKTHKPLVLRLGIHSDETTDAAMAPYIVEWLKAIGIQVTVQSMSFNELNSDLPKGDWDMLSDTWTVNPDPTFLLSIQTCGDLPLNNGTDGNTDAFFCNPQYDKLYTQQTTEFDPAQRVQTIDQMQQILYQNAVDVILYYPDWLSAIRTNVVKNYYYGKPNAQGFYPIPDEFINWRSATPVADSSSSGTSPAVWIVIAIVVVAVLAGGGFFLRRRSTAGERE
ncbi:MAG TPA: ABC transporter substrate-binding protein [Streptosporangiaceae bacterium]|jgi:peptide/nickel transport system substrate-binding protein|nr:ABC transporter substrate-binding protein [Streptosporangiaceae bacterium]